MTSKNRDDIIKEVKKKRDRDDTVFALFLFSAIGFTWYFTNVIGALIVFLLIAICQFFTSVVNNAKDSRDIRRMMEAERSDDRSPL